MYTKKQTLTIIMLFQNKTTSIKFIGAVMKISGIFLKIIHCKKT